MKIKFNIFKVTKIAMLFIGSSLFAQTTVTIPAANPAGTGSTASPYRKPLGTNRAYERSAMIYRHAEIGQLGTINSIAFFVDSLNLPGDAITRIFIKDVSDTVMTLSTVAAVEAGATLVYDDTIFATEFVLGNWINIPLTTAFTHASTNNIMVIVETNSGGTTGTDINTISKGFRYSATTNVTFQYWQSQTGSGALPLTNGTANLNRPNIQFEITALPSCIAPPNSGTVVASNDSVCVGNIINLSLSGADIGAGITYQWLSSNDGVNWTAVAGETNNFYNPIISSDSLFACEVTCSGVSDTAALMSIYLKPFYNCYCIDNLGGNCTFAIDSVSIVGTTLQNGASGCVTPYTAFPYSGSTTTTLTQGQSYVLATKFSGSTRTSLWIDYNHNGIFDNSEWTQVCITSVAGAQVLTNFSVPIQAITGITGMRIRSRNTTGANDTTTTCTNFGSGEMEDYLIDIALVAGCVAPPDAGIAVASQDSVCTGTNVSFTLNSSASGSGLSYEWITSTDGVNWVSLPGQNQPNYNVAIIENSFFACVVTCAAQSDTSAFATVSLNPILDCYCTTNLGGNCATTALDSIAIVSTTLANGLTGCAATFYTAFPASGSTTADLTQGQVYTLVTRYNGATRAGCWIDYNHNGVFNNNEWTAITNTATAGIDVVSSINIPYSSLTGQTVMRIRTRATNGALDSTLACATFGSGETEDYIINILSASACVAPPDAGFTVASQDSVCNGNSTSITLNASTTGTGVSYQWISSNDGVNWLVISGQNQIIYNPVINSDSSFACIVTCSGQSDTSTFVSITLNSYFDCYCITSLGGNCATTALDSIAIVSTTFSNGLTGCAPTFYTSYPASGSTTADLTQGQTYTVISRYNGATRAGCWIDYDHSGTFDNTEWTLITNAAVAGVDVSSLLQIPLTANLGQTKMRIRTRATNGALDSTLACGTFGSGETEDYIINILAAPNCISPPSAGSVQASQDTICAGNTVVYSLNGIVIGLGQTYQWLASNDGVNWIDLVGETSTTLTAIISSDSLFACVVICSGLSDTSASATVYINSFYDCYCTQNVGGNCAASAIDSVTITNTTLQNGPTGCAPTFYTAYPNVGNTTTDLMLGQTYELVAKFNANVRASMWIDYDHNSVFDTYEWVQICDTSIADSNVFVNFTVPVSAQIGLTGMRVRSRVTAGANDSTSACAAFGTGEIEDYLVNISQIVGLNNRQSNVVNIFPNPSNGHFTILSTSKINQVNVFDICGKEMKLVVEQINNNQSSISIAHKGIFIIQVTDYNGNVKTHKVIVN